VDNRTRVVGVSLSVGVVVLVEDASKVGVALSVGEDIEIDVSKYAAGNINKVSVGGKKMKETFGPIITPKPIIARIAMIARIPRMNF